MPDFVYIVIIIIMLVALAIAGFEVLRIKARLRQLEQDQTSVGDSSLQFGEVTQEDIVVPTADINNRADKVMSIIQRLHNEINQLGRNNEDYRNELSESEREISEKKTLQELETLEQVLLGNIQRMRKASESFQTTLDSHESRVATEGMELMKQRGGSDDDEKTGLGSRKFFERQLVEKFMDYRNTGTNHAVGLIDITDFHGINEKYGFEIGDKVLEMVSRVLSDSRRPGDFISRLEKDWFGIILPNTNEHTARIVISGQTSKIVNASLLHKGKNLNVEVCGAVGIFIPDDNMPIQIMERLLLALGEAKDVGRAGVVKIAE